MKPLSGKNKRHLRGLANTLKPVVHIGKSGFSESVQKSIMEALSTNELIKVRFLEFKETKKEICLEIAEKCKCHHVGLIGHVGTFYREHKEKEMREIRLYKD